jgi:hypothetical protein
MALTVALQEVSANTLASLKLLRRTEYRANSDSKMDALVVNQHCWKYLRLNKVCSDNK